MEQEAKATDRSAVEEVLAADLRRVTVVKTNVVFCCFSCTGKTRTHAIVTRFVLKYVYSHTMILYISIHAARQQAPHSKGQHKQT